MTAPTNDELLNADQQTGWRWLPLLTALVVLIGAGTAYSLIRVGGIEQSNRDIICQSRELREKYAPETKLEKAQLENARRNATDCP